MMAERGGLGGLIERSAVAAPGAIALVAPDRPPATYALLAGQVERIAATLRAHGVGPAHRVAVALPNGPELGVAIAGVAAHAVCAPLDPSGTENELRSALDDLRANLVIVPEGVASAARTAAHALGIAAIGARRDTALPAGVFELAGARETVGAPSAPLGGDVALLLRTSGTTSQPKRVPLTHAQLCRSAANIAATLQLTARDRCLNVMPLFHVHGLVAALLASLHAGASVACLPSLEDGRFVEWLRTLAPTWYTAVPAIHQAVLHELGRCAPDAWPRGLRFVRSASAELQPHVAEALEAALEVPVIEAYGMTEAAHQIACNPLPPGRRRFGTVGLPTGPEVAVMNAAGELLPADAIGEIVIRGDTVIDAYDADAAINGAAFHGGWLRTGDAGARDADGYLRITGRLKEMINRGGEKIAPRDVEEALLRCDGVLECAAFAVPHATLGEDVIAAVVAKPGVILAGDAVRESLFGRIGDARIPSRVLVVGALPKGASGKIRRLRVAQDLRDRVRGDYVAPRGDLETLVAALFAEVLGIDRVGATDNFFVLGGDSLRGGQVVARVRAQLRVDLTPAALFRHPTPRELGDAVAAAQSAPAPPSGRLHGAASAAAIAPRVRPRRGGVPEGGGKGVAGRRTSTANEPRRALHFATPEPFGRSARPARFAVAHGEVHVHAFALEGSAHAVDAWHATLDADERARAARFRREADRNAYVVAHGIVRAVLGGYLDVSPRSIDIRRGIHGKPTLAVAGPGRASGIAFNLSHAAGRALLAVSSRGPVGIDLEAERHDIDPLEIARHAFHQNEIDEILREEGAARRSASIRHWVAKEALVKGIGAGLTVPIDRIELRFAPAGDRASAISHGSGLSCSSWTAWMLPLPQGWHGAVATEGTAIRLFFPQAGVAAGGES